MILNQLGSLLVGTFALRLYTRRMKKLMDFLEGMRMKAAVEIGSGHIRISLAGKGLVVDEAMVVARRKKRVGQKGVVVAVGNRAAEMIDREPGQMELVWPILGQNITDMGALTVLVRRCFLNLSEMRAGSIAWLKPKVILILNGGMSQVQRRAMMGILKSVGAGEVVMVESLVAAAAGLGLPTKKTGGVMIVDVGFDKTEAGLVSFGGVVVSRRASVGGRVMDLSIINYLKIRHGLLIGRVSAEKLKILIGSESELVARGRDLEKGLPKTIKINASQVSEAVSMEVLQVVDLVKKVIDETPSELMEEVVKKGIYLIGNGARLLGLAKAIELELKLGVNLVENGDEVVVAGGEKMLLDHDLEKTVRLMSAYN